MLHSLAASFLEPAKSSRSAREQIKEYARNSSIRFLALGNPDFASDEHHSRTQRITGAAT